MQEMKPLKFPNATVRRAYIDLMNRDVHVLDPELGWGGYFAISAEMYGDGSRGDDPDRKLDYYSDPWGERTIIPRILDKYGLYFEWINPGVVGVYEK